MQRKTTKKVGANKNFGPIQKLTVPDFQHITNVYEQMQSELLDKPSRARKQPKPFTIRKAGMGTNGNRSGAADLSMDADAYASATSQQLQQMNQAAAQQEETNLTPEELEGLQPKGLKVVNPWIHEQTHKQYLPHVAGLPARHANVVEKHQNVIKESTFLHADDRNVDLDKATKEALAILDKENDIFKSVDMPDVSVLTRYDTWDQDRSVEEWLEHCAKRPTEPHALSPLYIDNEYSWKPVQVKDYDYKEKKYVVVQFGSAKEKKVTRLSLLFYAEDPEQFRERVNLCKTRRKHVEAELRFTDMVDQIPADAVSVLSYERRESFVLKCVDQKERFEQSAVYRNFSNLMRVVQEEYVRQMKKCIVMQEMQNPANFDKFNKKKVPIRVNKKTYPYFGVVSCPAYDFKEFEAEILRNLWSSDPDLAELTRIFSSKSIEFMKKQYLETNRSKMMLPKQLEDMKKDQAMHCDQVQKNMNIQWREFLVSEIRRKLREKHNIFVQNLEQYAQSPLRCVILRFEFILNNYMREFVQNSINQWVSFIQSFTRPKYELDELWALSKTPMLRIKLDILKPVKDDSKKKKSRKIDDAEKAPEGPNADKEDETLKRVRYKPALRDCGDFMVNQVELMRNTTNGFLSLEKDLVTFLNLEERASFYLDEEFPWLVDARSKIEAIYEENVVEPEALLAKYKKFEFVLNVDKKALISNLFKREGEVARGENKAPYEEIREQIEKFNKAEYEILNVSNDVVDYPLFQVHAKDLKQKLASDAASIRDKLLERVDKWCTDSVNTIESIYEEMRVRISQTPEDENQLVDLRDFTTKTQEQTLEEQFCWLKEVERHYELLDEYSFAYQDKEIEHSLMMKQYPMIIGEVLSDGKQTMQEQEELFIVRLDQEKEQFNKELASYKETFKKIKTFSDIDTYQDYYRDVSALDVNLQRADDTIARFNMRSQRLNQQKQDQGDFETLNTEFQPFKELLTTAYNMISSLRDFRGSPLLQANYDYESMEGQVIGWYQSFVKLQKKLMEDHPEASDAAGELKKTVEEFRKNLPLIKCVMSEALVADDWADIKDKIDNENLDPNAITVDKFESDKLAAHYPEIEEITSRAEKRFQLSKKLKAMREEMREFKLKQFPYKDGTTFVLKSYDEINAKLDDQTVATQAMLSSSNCTKKFRQETKAWETKLLALTELIEEINKCQKQWFYLEPIFASEDIGKTLAQETAAFIEVDKSWRKTMEEVEAEPGILELGERDSMHQIFINNNRNLEKIQRSLNEYLEQKRLVFPRFYFLADSDLLMILAQTKDPTLVQSHMDKCFEGIQKVMFSDKMEVFGMISAEGEEVLMNTKINVNEGDKKGNVEKWMLEIERVMISSLKQLTKESIQDYYNNTRPDWVKKWPGQIVLAVDQIDWTKGAEEVFDAMAEGKMEAYRDKLQRDILDIVDMVRGKLTNQLRTTLKALVVIDVHAKDVIQLLIDKQIQSKDEFEWGSQLRYYWTQEKKTEILDVRMVTATIPYGFEYLGNSPRLVITPLTDRCYRTLMGAKNLNYGGAPEGPAGTGKTESVKDLAKALAVQCVVFNCQDSLDHNAMAKFFKGLASSGAWCCFDEFNRIDLEVLSVIAQQIMVIQKAIVSGRKNFDFEGTPNLVLNPACAVNITMNPGYAGRSELPDNLKALFRPCAMMVPNYAMIGEIELYSFGFSEAKILAVKVVASLRLSSEQLSTQDHYDFGMRALKAILTACGRLRQVLDWSEDQIGLRALKDVNLPKFTTNDIPLYQGITSDLFPGIDLPKPDYSTLMTAMKNQCVKMNLQPKDDFLLKCIQLYETIMVRHGLMLVGHAFSAKSSVIQILKRAFTEINNEDFAPVQTDFINPKSIKQTQLYGLFDEDSGEWTDGVLALIIVQLAQQENKDRKWIIFDGPVDAVWIENMNTVLDDNKKLCLASGAIIKLKPEMTIMFEVEDLAVASPATVSRCGMVLLEPKQLGFEVLIESYCTTLKEYIDPKIVDKVKEIFYYLFNLSMEYIYRECKFPVPTGPNFITANALKMFDSFVSPWKGEADEPAQVPKDAEQICFNAIIFAAIWGIGAQIDETTRAKYDLFLQELIIGEDVKEKFTLDAEMITEPMKIKNSLQDYKSLFDFSYKPDENKWINWNLTVPAYEIPVGASYAKVIVPTIDSIRVSKVLNSLLVNKTHTLVVGPTGTGKSIMIMDELNTNFQNEERTFLSLAFSAQTSANQTQRIIDNSMHKKRKGYFGPEAGKSAVIFVDDINMPMKEKYGAQPPIELLRQWMDYGGWYDLDGDKEFRYIVNVTFCAAMQPPEGAKKITNRYVRHYNVLYVEPYSDESLNKIFKNVMDWLFASSGKLSYNASVKSCQSGIVSATISTYQEMQARFKPTPAKSHYTYNLRDVSKVFQGIAKTDPRAMAEDKDMIKLWAHECMRVFQDRLISVEDRDAFEEMLKVQMKDKMKKEWENIVEVSPLLFSSFTPTIYPDGDKAKKPIQNIYCELTDREKVSKVANENLQEYNDMNLSKKMDLVLFSDAIEHVVKIHRVITTQYGNALLVGVGGSGRKSLTTLATKIAEFEMLQLEITKGYGMKEWRENMRDLLFMKCGFTEESPLVFLFSDTQIINEAFVEDLNNILNNGKIPNLYNKEDISQIVEGMKEEYKANDEFKEIQDDAKKVIQMFEDTARDNLHLILAMSPIGDDFKRRLRMFPALVNCCTIDWFLPWPSDALQAVATQFLKQIDNLPSRDGIVKVCVDMQERVRQLTDRYKTELRRYYYVTPTSYLILIKTFTSLLDTNRSVVERDIKKFDKGLKQMQSAAEQIDTLKEQLNQLIPELKVKAEQTAKKQKEIEIQKVEADKIATAVKKEEEIAKDEKAKATAIENECKTMLDQVMPIYHAAMAAVAKLKPADVTEMSKFVKASPPVAATAEALCYFFDEKPVVIKAQTAKEVDTYDWWTPCKKKILNSKLLKSMQDYPRDDVQPALVEKMKPLMEREEFQDKVLKTASTAAFGIGKWCKAIIQYDEAMKVVKPKKAQLAEAQATSKEAQRVWDEAKAKLEAAEAEMKRLIDELNEAKEFEKNLRDKKEDCENKLQLAELLIGSLKSERESWDKQLLKSRQDLINLEGDILISSGIIAYLGVFIRDYRDECIKNWGSMLRELGINSTENVSLNSVLGNQVKISKWNSQGLPQDEFSIDNAIMLDYSDRWALMIDPQMQANIWLRQRLRDPSREENGPSVTLIKPTMNQTEMARSLRTCIEMGTPVIFEDATETFDPMLDPLLAKQIEKKGSDLLMQFGDRQINFNEDFQFFITTKMPGPHYSPEICVKLTILNFQVTPDGLLDQMLNEIIRIEEATKFENRKKLITQKAENMLKKAELDDKILDAICNTGDDILEDVELRDVLGESKERKNQIEQANAEAESMMKVINKIRDENVPVGLRVSRLYFVLTDLTSVDPMYQYSLEFFKTIFEDSVRSAEEAGIEKSQKKEKRAYWISEFTKRLYNNVSRSLFQKDNLLFSFLICLKIMDENLLQTEGGLNMAELRFLMAGATQVDITKPNPTGEGGWLSDSAWLTILEMSSKFPAFTGLDDHFIANVKSWEDIYNSPNPQSFKQNPWPGKWNDLRLLQKSIILRAIRPDKVIPMVQKIVKKQKELGKYYLTPPHSDFNDLYNDSKNTTPIIIVITSGADPMTEIFNYSKQKHIDFESLSLGKGQDKKAIRAITKAQTEPTRAQTIGTWVVLQNCHLAPSFLPTLDGLLQDVKYDPASTFRIWITTESSNKFPVTIVQNGIKMTSEPPKGLQQNIMKSYRAITDKDFDNSTKPVAFRRLLWGLCFFNAIILERRKFGPLGWNIGYQFSASDLKISTMQLAQFLDFYEQIPFEALQYMVAEANYGGRVTQEQDRRTIITILKDYYNAEMISEENHPLCESGTYYVPSDGSRDDYLQFIEEKIPFNDLTEIFGLHGNAEITSAINTTNLLMDTALSLQPRVSSSGGKSQDEILTEQAQQILSKLPERFDLEAAAKKHPIKYEDSMNTVLQQEILRFNKLYDLIKNSLVNIQRAIKGEVVMSTDLELLGTSLFDNKIPDMWKTISYPSLKPLASYVLDLNERLDFIQNWIDNGAPAVYWISGFYFTQSFLTGLKQNFARKYTIAIDRITFDFNVISDPAKTDTNIAAEDGAYINGLYIEGCRWDSEQEMLEESFDKQLFTKMPLLHLIPQDENLIAPRHTYTCPVYKTITRQGVLSTTGHSTNFVLYVQLNMQKRHTEDHWVKRGVAMICSLND